MTLYSNGISSGDIGGAVAEAILEDIRVNGLALEGFPQIIVSSTGGDFHVTMCFGEHARELHISRDEAERAVQKMKARRGFSTEIFDRVQEAAAHLEGTARNNRP